MAIGTGTALLGGSLISGLMGGRSAKKAAKVQAQAATQAADRLESAAREGATAQQNAYTNAGQLASDALGQSGNTLTNASNAALQQQLTGASGARDAALAGVNGAQAAYQTAGQQMLDQNQAVYDGQSALYNPYIQSGTNALNALNYELGLGAAPDGYSGYSATPGFQFALDSANRAIEGSASARGGLFSGATMQALSDNTVGMAQQDYGNFLDRLTGQSNVGYGASGQMANALAGFGTSNNAVYDYLGQANANAATQTGNINAGYAENVGNLGAQNALDIGNIGSNVLLGQADAMGQAGVNSANALANGLNTAAQAGAAGITGAANANSAGIIGANNSWQNALEGITGGIGIINGQLAGQNKLAQKPASGTSATTTTTSTPFWRF
ncbi:hypothetical protein BVG79_01088 [Ketogulonicigenium robustum]|uniref:DNA transfer protein p32 n=1 Tax=Ketogulonicigenium robustum TaxID=92947 RepID=A0A1W6NYZ0_9RHOB|nr:hypothetical protein [Ketogulonicigenium robustum]ARO14434.1 hypothetical protein BVG79_01088 [Ketogulonicigenium robustum]